MPLSALALVLLAGLIHASWNIAAKQSGGDARFAMLTSLVLAVFWAPVAAWASWHELPEWPPVAWLAVAVSALLHVGYYLVLLRGYRLADLTVVYPLARGSGPLLSSLVAFWLLGEAPSRWGVTGILAVVVGVFLIAGGPRLLRRTSTPEDRARLRSGIGYGVATGVFIAAYTVVDGWSVKVLGLSPILVDYIGNLFRILLLLPLCWALRAGFVHAWRRQRRAVLFVGVVSPMSYVLVLYAMQMAPLSHVAPAREVSMLFAALLGGHLLGEGDRLVRFCGAACIAAGVMALALG